jgi:excisionase family DNA binding protein
MGACMTREYSVVGAAPRDLAHHHIGFSTVAEVAARLGVSVRTVRRWIKSGDLVAHRFGSAVRIAESDLKAFIARHRDR